MAQVLLLLTGVLCISTSAIVVTLSRTDPTVSAFYRNFLAALAWFLLLRIWPRSAWTILPPDRPDRPEHGMLAKRAFSPRILHGLLCLFFALDLWAWHRAIPLLGAGPATLAGNLQVLIVSLAASILFGERLGRHYLPGCILALAGIALLTLTPGGGRSTLLGLGYGLLTAVCYAAFLLALKLIRHSPMRTETILFRIAWGTALILAMFALLEGKSLLLPSRASLAWLLLHAVVSSVAGWWCIIRAMQAIPVSASSVLLLLQPLLTSLWGALVLGQTLSFWQVTGIGIAVAGIHLASRRPPAATA